MTPALPFTSLQKQELDSLLSVHYEGALDRTVHIIIRNAIYSAGSKEQVLDYLRDSISTLEVALLIVECFQAPGMPE